MFEFAEGFDEVFHCDAGYAQDFFFAGVAGEMLSFAVSLLLAAGAAISFGIVVVACISGFRSSAWSTFYTLQSPSASAEMPAFF